jgi:hypothetical protein
VAIVALTTQHPYTQRLALTSPTSGGRSVGIDRLGTTGTEFNFSLDLFLTDARILRKALIGELYCSINCDFN